MIATLPGVVIRVAGVSGSPVTQAGLYGLAIVGASFLLAWSAEAAQLDIPPALAIGALALVAVLPEYVVGNVFAWRGGHEVARYGAACQAPVSRLSHQDSSCTLALANMLGANRLLIGIGWSMVVLIAWYRRRRRDEHIRAVALGRSHSVELSFLALASLWCLSLPLRRSVTVLDSAVLMIVFAGYGLRVARATPEEPQLEGVASWIGAFGRPGRRRGRRLVAATLLGLAAVVIFLCANAFADALVSSGQTLGIDEFFLVQWVAPLASEAPELLIASVYAWRLRAAMGLGALVSSKVNQWTILVGSLPVVFALASGSLHGLPLGSRERQELALTAAQSFFGVAVLGNLDVSIPEAVTVFVLFTGEFVGVSVMSPDVRANARIAFTVVYLVIGGAILLVKRRDTVALVRDGFRTPYAELGGPR